MEEIAPKIVIDPKVRFGKPIIKGTRITVEEVLGFLTGGMDYKDIEKEYGIKKEEIVAAINYAAAFLKGEEIKHQQAENQKQPRKGAWSPTGLYASNRAFGGCY